MAQLRSFDDLVAFLVKQKVSHQVDAANQLVQLATKLPALPYTVIIRWEQDVRISS